MPSRCDCVYLTDFYGVKCPPPFVGFPEGYHLRGENPPGATDDP
jgi:hypothetical protein